MAIAAPPVMSSRRYRPAAIVILLALFLGLLSFAAVREMRVECGPILMTGGGKLLTGDGALMAEGEVCALDLGEHRMQLPNWAVPFVNVFAGAPSGYGSFAGSR